MVKVTQPPVGVWSLDAEDFIYCHDTSSIVENTMKVQTIKQKLSVILQLQLIFPPHAGMYMCMLERKGRERQIGGGVGRQPHRPTESRIRSLQLPQLTPKSVLSAPWHCLISLPPLPSSGQLHSPLKSQLSCLLPSRLRSFPPAPASPCTLHLICMALTTVMSKLFIVPLGSRMSNPTPTLTRL